MKNIVNDSHSHICGGQCSVCQFWIETKVDGVRIGRKKNEAPKMLENVLVFGGLSNPAEGLFRNLVFSSPHGEFSHFYLVPTRMGTFITYCLAQQKLDISRYMMKLWKCRIVWQVLNFLRSRVEVYLLSEDLPDQFHLIQRVNFNPAPQKNEAFLGNSVFPECHHIPRYV